MTLLLAALSTLSPVLPPAASAGRPPDGDAAPLTVPEQTDYTATSTCAAVQAFLRSLGELPHADRLRVGSLGRSHEGRDLTVVAVGDPLPARLEASLVGERLRVLVNANIHGGEVEGKEAVQMLLREFARGEHGDLLERAVIAFVPVYNADGNDRIAVTNRASQNGPDGGVGERANAQGLDLNRDFVKAESPECRALLGLLNAWDPHLFMDLHTTDGSPHGYHLTYAPSLCTNVDPELDRFAREAFLPAVRRAVRERHGFRVFDYGNFGRQRDSWSTYDHRPRYGTNYVGLRNRLSVLSEAYSYLPFAERVAVTRAFVLETLRAAVARAGALDALCEGCDRRAAQGEGSVAFAWDTELAEGRPGPVLVGTLSTVEIEGVGRRRIAGEEWSEETMLVRDRFVSRRSEPLPAGWAVPEPSAELLEALRHHGLSAVQLEEPVAAEVLSFSPSVVQRAEREFQGHRELSLEGAWVEDARSLPAGALVIDAAQPLARLAAQLLEPLSEDSLSTWGVFEAQTHAGGGVPGAYPVLRLRALPEVAGEPLPVHRESGF